MSSLCNVHLSTISCRDSRVVPSTEPAFFFVFFFILFSVWVTSSDAAARTDRWKENFTLYHRPDTTEKILHAAIYGASPPLLWVWKESSAYFTVLYSLSYWCTRVSNEGKGSHTIYFPLTNTWFLIIFSQEINPQMEYFVFSVHLGSSYSLLGPKKKI